MASTRRILDLLAVPPTITPGAATLPADGRGHVRFDTVDFAYTSGSPVLRDFDLDVPAGETHAIVGSTGAGKSTVVKLLLRLYEPTGGAVRIDEADIRDLTFPALRGALGYVGQDVFLFQGTVRENVAYGRPDATDEEVVEACRLAEADAFVNGLPQGYDTIVGERGQKLSGGQRQRLTIARAILRDPAILVLDEATSAVDNETEAAIQRSLERVSAGRTTIVIAHRLSTVWHAYAKQFAVSQAEAERRLRALAESVVATDSIEATYRDRVAGVSIEHKPALRILVYLTGEESVPNRTLNAGEMKVPIVFRTGAKASRDRVIWAMTYHQAAIRAALPTPPAMGLDPRTGELVVVVPSATKGKDALRTKLEGIAGVPVRLRVLDQIDVNLSAPLGGSRVEGLNPADGKRYLCTTAFTVTDGKRYGIATAAHCLDDLTYLDPRRVATPLSYVAQWGWGYQESRHPQ